MPVATFRLGRHAEFAADAPEDLPDRLAAVGRLQAVAAVPMGEGGDPPGDGGGGEAGSARTDR